MEFEKILTNKFVILIFISAGFIQFIRSYTRGYDAGDVLDGIEVEPKLLQHTKEFNEKIVYKVTDEVYVAVGYALSNSILIIAPDGAIIVDTTESIDAAREIYEEFRKITDKPIKAFIYTHNHPDHVIATQGFLDDPDNPPDIWARHTLTEAMESTIRGGLRNFKGGQHQFGTELGERLVNAGIGPFVRLKKVTGVRNYLPNKFLYKDEEEIEIAGMNLRLIHIPGETPDQIGVWLPDSKVLLPAANVYRAFPNLYAIGGTPPRNILHWSESLVKMRALGAEQLVPSHTRPVTGADRISSLLTDYKDAIQFVHDQSLRFINQGYHPSEVVEMVKLPEHLADNPHLLEFYGTVEWSVRAVYDMYFGWFSGDPVDLAPLPPKTKAQKMVDLVGSYGLMSAAQTALANDEHQWALELVSYIFTNDPQHKQARDLRLQVLRKLAAKQRSAPARNFYSTVALNDYDLIHTKLDTKSATLNIPFYYLFEAMKTRLKAEAVVGVTLTTVMNFTDVDEIYTLRIHNCVLVVETAEAENYDLKITTESIVWREVVVGIRSSAMAYTSGAIEIEGGLWLMRDFQSYFDRPE